MQRKTAKTKYHLRNWCEYNAASVPQGTLTLWVRKEALIG
jgi:hypothetical protein